jgi:hypothetical protein
MIRFWFLSDRKTSRLLRLNERSASAVCRSEGVDTCNSEQAVSTYFMVSKRHRRPLGPPVSRGAKSEASHSPGLL